MTDQYFNAVARHRKHAQFQEEAKQAAYEIRLEKIRAEQANGPKMIWIDAPIGQEPGELSARWLRGQLPIDGREVTLQVHCEGGSVFEALAMIDVLTSYRGKVRAVVSSMALSAASLLLTACDDVQVTSNSYLMLHNSRMDDAELSPTEADLLDSLNERMVGMYAARSRQPASEIRRMMADETFLDANESVRLGFADKVVTASNLRIVARAIPKRIVAQIKTPSRTATARWREAVDAKAATTTRAKAILAVDKEQPGLRLKMIAEANKR